MKAFYLDNCDLLMKFWFVSLITLCRCISSTPMDHVMLLNPPKELVPAHSLRVQYSCSRSAVVYLDVLASSETRIGVNIFRRRWRCVVDHPRIKVLQLDLPDRIIYRDDWKIRNSVWLLSAMLRAWVSSDGDESYASASARAIVLLQPLPPFSRPLKEHSLCPRWDVELLWRLHKDTIPKCKAEPEVAHFLKFVYASSGENFGIVRTLNPYGNKALEQMRQRSTTFPRCNFSTWIYLTQSCRWRFCGVLHHLDWNNNYASPAIFITHTGSLHIQVQQVSGKSAALLSEFKVPLFQWCRIDTELQAKQVNVTMVCVGDQKTLHSTVHTFGGVIQLDDTEGYFVLGGGRFVRGIEGFYGPSVYHRNGFSSAHQLSELSLPEPIRSLDFAGWFNSCWAFKDELLQKRRGYAMRAQLEGEAASCSNVYTEWFSRSDPAPPLPQCLQWEAPVHPRRRPVTRLIQQMAARNGGTGRLDLVGKKLYTLFLRRVTQDGGIAKVRPLMPLLLQAGCLGDHSALYLSAVLYHTGFGVNKIPGKAVLLSLLAAQQDSRLALLRLGNLHHLGESGLPVDHALAYAYYSNMAAQTLIDKQHPSPGQAYVESIRLIDEEVLKQQTSENDDLFLWLRFQARRGVADAQQNLGRMLFWGQQGVSPNLQAAVKYYKAGARKEENPVSMYDYAIVLLKGHGVEQDIPKALKFLNKAAKQDFVPAINALGWYYERFEQDYERAVQFWERADEMGNPEAPFNLGVMYSLGLYPGKRADQFMAYKYYLKSARRAHTDGAIRLADVWIRGIPGLVPRLPLDAVLWTKWASEQNGYLGALLRKSLEAYLRQDWSSALIHYLMASESGFAVAQFNLGYLCEQHAGSLLSPAFRSECVWRYYNLSTYSQDPAPYALIKMGDLLYAGHEQRKRDVKAAAEMYKLAALRDEAQGWYSLGLLVQEGVELPRALLTELGLEEPLRADNHSVLIELFRRCRDHENAESYLPCSLALLNAQLQLVLRHHSAALKFTSAIGMAIVSIVTVLTTLGRLRGLTSHNGLRV